MLIPTRAPSIVGWVLGFLPWWAWAALVALAVATATGMGWQQGAGHVQARWNAEKATRVQQALEASQEARRIEQQRAAKVQEINDDYAARARRDRAAADSARGELDGLRHTLGAADSAASAAQAAGRADGGSAARSVVGYCAQSLLAMAETADACESRLSGLQGYVRAVTGAAASAPPAAPAPQP